MLEITGDGDPAYMVSMRRSTDELGIERQVRFIGPGADMPRFDRACDIICVPSESESFGRTVIEAMAVGTPVVATAVGGMRETVEPGLNGLQVEYGDAAALSRTILDVLGDPALAAALTDGGRRSAQAEYSARQYQERLIRIVLTAVGETHSRLREPRTSASSGR